MSTSPAITTPKLGPKHFAEYRGLVQLRLQTPDDLEHLHTLEPARWSATSVPVEQLLCDPAFLAILDGDKNGRVRVHDFLAEHAWARARFKDKSRFAGGNDTIRFADLDETHADFPRLRALAVDRLGVKDEVTLAQIRAFAESYKKKVPNGDGVVTPGQLSGDEAALAQLVVDDTGGVADLSGDKGADQASLDAFLGHAKEMLAWEAARVGDEAWSTAVDAIAALEPKVEQFFAQCDLVGAAGAAEQRLTATVEALQSVDVKEAGAIRAYLADAAIARPVASAVLDTSAWLNPLFADGVRALLEGPLARVLGGEKGKPLTTLSRADWEKAKGLIAPARAHKAKKPRDLPGGLAGDALKKLVGATQDGDGAAKLTKVIAEDKRASDELQALGDMERLALGQRWLLEVANNMVSFPALFKSGARCLFEAGTLVLDGRDMSFCIRVPDRAAHKAVAESSNVFVVYVDLDRKDGDTTKTQQIAAAVTSGTRRGIAVGKRGVFYDRDGKEWDARIADIIVKPISLWEAAIAPFVRLRDLVAERIEKMTAGKLDTLEAGARDKTVVATDAAPGALAAAATAPPPAAKPAAPAAPAAPAGGGLQSVLVGGGIAVAAIGSASAFALQTLSSIKAVDALLAIAGVAGGIMLLSGFLGWLKLRKRDLSTLLEASGWAFNVRIYLTRRHSLRFTRVPPLPEGSVKERVLLPQMAAEDKGDGGTAIPLAVLVSALLVAAYVFREPLLALLRGGGG